MISFFKELNRFFFTFFCKFLIFNLISVLFLPFHCGCVCDNKKNPFGGRTAHKHTQQQLDVLKTENQRLRDENGALIRVISKLSK